MKIQLDIDGTLDRSPGFFRWLSTSLRKDGHDVLIVTSRVESPGNRLATERQLEGWKISYDTLILSPPPDDLDEKKLPKDLHPAHRQFITKVFVARDDKVDILFDDCGITAELFKRYLPKVLVFRPW